jgi:hypothetical protein
VIASLVVGFFLTVMIFLCSFFRGTHSSMSIHAASLISLFIMGVISGAVFIIQLISGPLVFTKDVVCQVCHRQQKLGRIPFFQGKYYRQPKCECGGDLEPAFFWEMKP